MVSLPVKGLRGTVGLGGQWTRHKGTILGIIKGLVIKESNQAVVVFQGEREELSITIRRGCIGSVKRGILRSGRRV